VVVDAVMIDGWMLGMIEVKGWFGGERENKVDMFWNRVFVGGVLVGWEREKSKYPIDCCVLGRSDRRADRARATRYPPHALFRLQCNQLNQVRGVRRTPHRVALHGIAMIPASNAARRACVPSARNPFLSAFNTPLQPSHIRAWNNACGGSCTIRSGMRHEDDLVCSPGLRFHERGNVIAPDVQDPGHWRSAV
jgi:hypothetical protein